MKPENRTAALDLARRIARRINKAHGIQVVYTLDIYYKLIRKYGL